MKPNLPSKKNCLPIIALLYFYLNFRHHRGNSKFDPRSPEWLPPSKTVPRPNASANISNSKSNHIRQQVNSREENGLSYGLSRLVAPSGESESRSESISPQQLPYHMSFFGGTATQRLPSMSPISIENNFVQSPLESPISRDLISPSTRTTFNITPRSPTTRRLRATNQDAITRRYLTRSYSILIALDISVK